MGRLWGGGITTQGDTLGDLPAMIADAVGAYFEAGEVPARVTVHPVEHLRPVSISALAGFAVFGGDL